MRVLIGGQAVSSEELYDMFHRAKDSLASAVDSRDRDHWQNEVAEIEGLIRKPAQPG